MTTRREVNPSRKRTITFQVDVEWYERLQEAMAHRGQTMSEVIRHEMTKYINRYERKVARHDW